MDDRLVMSIFLILTVGGHESNLKKSNVGWHVTERFRTSEKYQILVIHWLEILT